MNSIYSKGDFLEKYGLCDLIVEYLYHSNDDYLHISEVYEKYKDITESDLITFFKDTYFDILINATYLKRTEHPNSAQYVKYTSHIKDKTISCISPHVIIGDKGKTDKSIGKFSDINILVSGKKTKEFNVNCTKNTNPFVKDYQITNELYLILSICSKFTKNKLYSRFDYYIPEYDSIEDMLAYIYAVKQYISQSEPLIDVKTYTNEDIYDKKGKLKATEILKIVSVKSGNIGNKYFNVKSINKYLMKIIYEVQSICIINDNIDSILTTNKKLSKCKDVRWYCIDSDSNINLIELVITDFTFSEIKSAYLNITKGYDEGSSIHLAFLNLIKNMDIDSLLKVIKIPSKDKMLLEDNKFLQKIINNMNIDKDVNDKIRDFVVSVSNQIYYTAKDYVVGSNHNSELSPKQKESIEIRKNNIRKELSKILDRDYKDTLSLLFDMCKFLNDKHKINISLIDVIDMPIDVTTFRKLMYVYLYTSNKEYKENKL